MVSQLKLMKKDISNAIKARMPKDLLKILVENQMFSVSSEVVLERRKLR